MTTEHTRRIPADVADAVTALYNAAYRDVLRSTTVLAGAADAPDLVQYAFQKAALKWDEVGSRSLDGQKAWLRTVARNRFIDDLRRDVHFDELHFQVCEHYTSAPHNPADVTVARAALERCWAVISAMPRSQRAVAVLAWREGLAPAEVAQSLGISPATVRVHLHKARLRLGAEVGEHLPFAQPAAQGTAQKRRAS